MSTKEARICACAEDGPRAFDDFHFGTADIREKYVSRQRGSEILNGIDDSPNVRSKDHYVAANARSCGVLDARVNCSHLLSLVQHTLFIGADYADSFVPQAQPYGATDESSPNDCDLLDHFGIGHCRKAAGSAPRSFGCGGAMRFAVTKTGSISVGMCVSRSSARCTSGRTTASVSSIFFARA